MPAKVVVMYGTPTDAATFRQQYTDDHVPLAKAIPGLRSFEVSDGPVNTPAGPAPFASVVLLTFDSMADLQAGMSSPEGGAAVAHAQQIATGGMSIYICEFREA
jgi:uncharacterized protein (TIGR02118 family)